jgi:lipid-A-disaccharide synthase
MSEVLIVAAEASSGLFAQRLLEHWKKEKKQIQAFGVGTPEMEALGFERLGKSEEMAVVGAAEVIEHFSHLKGVFNRLVEEAEKRRPKLAIVLDYPDFNLMLAKKLKALGIPVVYYISPQVWAWRKGRVKKIKQFCEKVLVLFPFEVAFYEAEGVPCEFVGHPILDELDPKYFSTEYRKLHRNRCGIQDDDIVIGLMPGSRTGEINQHLDIQLETARKLYNRYDKVRVLLMVAPTRSKEEIQDRLGDLRFPIIVQKDEPFEMIHLCDFILAASGTATLMVALLEKPMVIMYKMKWLTGIVAKLVVRGVRFFGLPNLILGREVIPERWQGDANPDHLAELMGAYIEKPEHAAKTKAALAEIRQHLGEKGATARVAKAVERYLS